MFGAANLIDQIIEKYPPELRQQIRVDLAQLINRERHYLCGQVQYALSQYHCCATLQSLRSDIDRILLENVSSDPATGN